MDSTSPSQDSALVVSTSQDRGSAYSHSDPTDSASSLQATNPMHDLSLPRLQLEIDPRWWLWRGYRYDQHTGYLVIKYGKLFDEAAFPSLKPDFCVFGTPRRSRKQRGWHQIRTSPLLLSNLPTDADHRALATASDIPPELFERFLAEIVPRFGDPTCCDKQALGTCSLVCQYWAKRCRRSIFKKITLRSRQDAVQLLEFMKTSGSTISRLVKMLNISAQKMELQRAPWLHIVPDIYRRLHTFEYISFKLEGPLPSGRKSLRSIHQALPRALPRFSEYIYKLSLTDIHFAKLDDLMHLAWEMPHLEHLICSKVTWGSMPTTLPTRKPVKKRPCFRINLSMSEGDPRSAEACTWLTSDPSLRFENCPFFCMDDFDIVLDLARSIDVAFTGVNGLETCIRFGSSYYVISISRILPMGITNFQKDEMELLCRIEFHDKLDNPSNAISNTVWPIRTITVDIPALKPLSCPEIDWTSLDWKAFNTATTRSFSDLRRVIMGFETQEDMVHFEDEWARANMTNLSGSGKLGWALWDPEAPGKDDMGRDCQGSWLRASPYSEDTYAVPVLGYTRFMIEATDLLPQEKEISSECYHVSCWFLHRQPVLDLKCM